MGERSCFFRTIHGDRVQKPLPFEVLSRLQEVVSVRLRERPEGSYTVKLAEQGFDRVLQKMGEESIETLIALKNGNKREVVSETADMLYMLTLALTLGGFDVKEIMEELIKRMR